MKELCQQLSGYFPQSEKVWFQAHGIGMEMESRLRQQCFDGTILAPNPSLLEVLEVLPAQITKDGKTYGLLMRKEEHEHDEATLIIYRFAYEDINEPEAFLGNEDFWDFDYTMPEPALELLLWLSENKLIGEVKSDTADVNAKYEHFSEKVAGK